jgi:hypothetical protein
MNKAKYIKPTVQVYEIEEEQFLLEGSAQGVNVSSSSATEEQRSRNAGSWDNEWWNNE